MIAKTKGHADIVSILKTRKSSSLKKH